MTTGCPHFWVSCSARMRAPVSVPPPGGNGTTSVTGRVGQAWPKAQAAARHSAAKVKEFFISFGLDVRPRHHLRPALALLVEEAVLLRGRHGHDLGALPCQPRADVGGANGTH